MRGFLLRQDAESPESVGVQFRLLGTVEATVDGLPVRLEGRKVRALLALLVLHANEVLRSDFVIDQLWGEKTPRSAEHAVRVYVSRLRKAMQASGVGRLLVKEPGGYVLRAGPEQIDVRRFERLLEEGRRLLAAGELGRAADVLRAALGEWRGDALVDVAFEPFADLEAARLEELRLNALQGRIEAELGLGCHAELVGELELLVREHPLDERFRSQLMLALYGSGRQAEALQTYQDTRKILVGELGIEPSEDLQRLERAILRHDTELDTTVAQPAPGIHLPQTHYARSGDVSIAYQITGEGPFDLVYVPPFVTNVELIWQIPTWAALLWRLSSFCRLIRFDKRGTGMSDRVDVADLETRMDDVRAVMDAACSARAALLGASDGGPLSLLFAATYPDRVWALVLWGVVPRTRWAPDYPAGVASEQLEREFIDATRIWTDAGYGEQIAGEFGAADTHALASMWRQSSSPGAIRGLEQAKREIDVRHVLPAINVPTLILSREGDEQAAAGSAYIASRIPGARHVELPGADHVMFAASGDVEPVVREIEQFLVSTWERDLAPAEPERVLTTVLVLDVVGTSADTRMPSDVERRALLEAHLDEVRTQLAGYRGCEVKTTGGTCLARFDGPARAVRCAEAIVESMRELDVVLRAAVRSGGCEVREGELAGVAADVGTRIATLARPGEVLVSGTVRDLVVGSGITFEPRGTARFEGVPQEWQLCAAKGGVRPQPARAGAALASTPERPPMPRRARARPRR